MHAIASITLWLFVIGTALIFGAGLYENLVVVPFWSTGAPASLAEGNPLLGVPVRPGRVFWSFFTPALGFIALLALATSFGTPSRHLVWRVAASGLLLMVSIATLVYFRPAIIGMVADHGAGRTPEALAEEAHRWVALNWVRILAVAACARSIPGGALWLLGSSAGKSRRMARYCARIGVLVGALFSGPSDQVCGKPRKTPSGSTLSANS